MLNRKMVINLFDRYVNDFVPCCSTDEYDLDLFKAVRELLKSQPEIIRCKDCKHYTVGHFAFCDLDHRQEGLDFFCADGEKRE